MPETLLHFELPAAVTNFITPIPNSTAALVCHSERPDDRAEQRACLLRMMHNGNGVFRYSHKCLISDASYGHITEKPELARELKRYRRVLEES